MRSPAKPASVSASVPSLPLSTLLSQTLVAFTIEFDNEFEHQMPHRTTNHSTSGSRDGPWLVSLVMWSNCMRFVSEDGVTVAELENLARTKTNLNGMLRWGYIVVEPDPADRRPNPPRSVWVIRATLKGRRAQAVWRPLFDAIEERWQARFGTDQIHQLSESLRALITQMDVELPDCLPILGYGLFSTGPDRHRLAPAGPEKSSGSRLPLAALLARVLLAFAIEFERESDLSLAISANVVRVLDEKGVRVRDLPLLTGVSKEAISMALGILQKKRYAVVEPDLAGSRAKVARLTTKGREAQVAYHRLLGSIEERWQTRFGQDAVRAIRELLVRLAGEPSAQRSPLFQGLDPYPDGWRASVRKPNTLPHYPMVLHRGGFPDGS
ncbi:MAG: MarR family winged helix-turn-helix transcriptional regulator [Acidobacteriia bacterium]|nr:MarR family winged helix-turn-helix transcriptional regulator [Terriglobia bacterium]